MRSRIEALSRKLQAQEESQREARDSLRASERAISEASRALAALEAESARVRREAAAIAERRAALSRSLAQRKALVARLVAARHAGIAPEPWRVALSGNDPAQIARTLHYVSYVTRASASALREFQAQLAEAERLAGEAEERRAHLESLAEAARLDRERIVAQRRERQQVLARIADEVRKSRKEIKVLRADEARLARLVAELAALPRQPSGATFSSLRGKLVLPVQGELVARFGAPRGAAGIESKGVFISAPEGRPVRAVASGQVVYADWMRGFGNLIIVDHGEAYLSIYANNESLLKQVGDAVGAGEVIATTGASGGSEQSGLYFELRHGGRAFDPLSWVKLK